MLTLLASFSLFSVQQSLPVLTLDRLISDFWMRMTPVRYDQRIVIVDVDEKSLAQVGRWPWSRQKIAQLVTELHEHAGAKVIAFDVLFADNEQAEDLELIDNMLTDSQFEGQRETLVRLRSERDSDQQLAKVLKGKPVTLGYYFTSDRDGHRSGELPVPLMQTQALLNQGWRVLSWNGYGANLKRFTEIAEAGFYSPRIDSDGLVREIPLVGDFLGQSYESLASVVLRKYLNSPVAQFTPDGIVYRTSSHSVVVPLTPEMTTLVPFAGSGGPNSGRFQYISAVNLLNKQVPRDALRDKIVLIGTTALGLTDLRATPVSPSFPGVEAHASILSGALDGNLKTRPSSGPWIMFVTVVLTGLFLARVLPRRGVIGVLLLSSLVALCVLAGHAFATFNLGWVLSIGALLYLIASLALLNLAVGYFVEGKSRRAVLSRFGEYVAPELVSKMAEDPQHYQMRSENKELTILFADIRGFTPLAESLSSQDLREYLNRFLGEMSEVIHRNRGTVDKFIGDAVMAFWGAPLDDSDHAQHAATAAREMLHRVARLNVEFSRKGLPPLSIGIGINTGVVRVGDMGTERRRTYTVIGDAVNLAARLEALTKQLDTPLAIGARTYQLLEDDDLLCLGQYQVTGKTEPVDVYSFAEFMSPPPLHSVVSRLTSAENLPDKATRTVNLASEAKP